jgi:tRNA pseudouridine55 synthase
MNGVIILDKPPGKTSHDAVAAVRGLLGRVRAGHAGTLDPNATGILILLLGKATKVSRFIMGLEKEYVFTVQLGVETDTLDRWGKVVRVVETPEIPRESIEEAASRLTGRYDQAAPAVSALKHEGVPLYRMARRGERVPTKIRPVEIRQLDILDVDYPLVTARVVCSSGTYVRALARDMGCLLGSVASVFCLRRTRIGRFGIDDAVPLDSVLGGAEKVEEALVPLRAALAHLPHVRVSRQGADGLRMGRQPRSDDLDDADLGFEEDYAALVDPDGEVVAIVSKAEEPGRRLSIERVL